MSTRRAGEAFQLENRKSLAIARQPFFTPYSSTQRLNLFRPSGFPTPQPFPRRVVPVTPLYPRLVAPNAITLSAAYACLARPVGLWARFVVPGECLYGVGSGVAAGGCVVAGGMAVGAGRVVIGVGGGAQNSV